MHLTMALLVGFFSSVHRRSSCIRGRLANHGYSTLEKRVLSARTVYGGDSNSKHSREQKILGTKHPQSDISRKIYRNFATAATDNIKNKKDEKLSTLVLLRHGQSTWNETPTFTGWCDAPLTERGILEAKAAGKLLYDRGFTEFDVAYTSTLSRAIVTCELSLDGIQQQGRETRIPMVKAWQLNERHYGALQGFLKNDKGLMAKYGEAQMTEWRRDFCAIPPPMDESHKYYEPPPAPLTESLKQCQERVLSYWEDTIYPTLMQSPGTNVLVAAHSNTLRALLIHLDGIPLDNVPKLHIPNSIPCVYKFDTSATNGSMKIVSPLLDYAGGGIQSRGQWLFSSENYARLRDKIGGDSNSFLRSMFEAWDLNGDGVLSREEIEIGLREIISGTDVSVAAIAGKILDEVDADGSETLDKEEFESYAVDAIRKFMPGLIDDHS